jgi:SAM-dependent methyltransferase
MKIIDTLFKDLAKGDELEVSFSEYLESAHKAASGEEQKEGRPPAGQVPIGFQTYLNLLNWVNAVRESSGWKVEKHITIDVIYNAPKDTGSYRVSIEGIDEINKWMEMLHHRKNHVVAKVLFDQIDPSRIIKKVKEVVHSIDDYGVRVRRSQERGLDQVEAKALSRSIGAEDMNRILFRYKQRVSATVGDADGVKTSIDLTTVKSGLRINRLEWSNERYEIELEMFRHKEGKNKSDIVENYKTLLTKILKVIDQTNVLMTRNEKNRIIDVYDTITKSSKNSLDVRQSVSLELYHTVDQLPNKYAVFDKADGDRYNAIVVGKHIYLISFNKHVRDSGIELDTDEWNGTLVDGEFLLVDGVYVFLAFDNLFSKGVDTRDEPQLIERLKFAEAFVRAVAPKGTIAEKNTEYSGKMEMSKIEEHVRANTEEYYRVLKYNIKKTPRGAVLFQRKLNLAPYGIQDNEVYKYMALIEQLNAAGVPPYKLDGCILTPLEQRYTSNSKEARLQEFKWKPAEQNSIDFYVKFVRDEKTGKIMDLYDNCREGALKGKTYRIAYLYVGMRRGKEEVPVLFQPQARLYEAFLFLDKGEVRDIEGNPIRDGTVAEFYYNRNSNLEQEYRWVPMRTRWDKTESVYRFKRRYGNNAQVADKVWRSIQHPILTNDLVQLANDRSYPEHLKKIKDSISQWMVTLAKREDVYYQKQSNLAHGMRDFHNWIKSILIYIYCNPIYSPNKRSAVLDIACGRGGDIMKFYWSRVDLLVGVDVDSVGIFSATDGANSRYQQMRRVNENFPPMYFIHADARIPFDAESQVKKLGTMSSSNIGLIKRFFDPPEGKPHQLFDRINCQFAMHYFLDNEVSWTNFCANIKKFLKPGGYMLITTLDAETVVKTMGENGRIVGEFTTQEGHKQKLFELTKKFNIGPAEQKKIEKEGYGIGYPVDFFNLSFMMEGESVTEYLVDPRFVKREFKDRCGMSLVETGMFSDLYNINREFFEKVAPWESFDKTRSYLLKTKSFYDMSSEMNRASFELTRLNRYYIFQMDVDEKEWSKISKTGPEVDRKRVPLKKVKSVPLQKGGSSTEDSSSSDDEDSTLQPSSLKKKTKDTTKKSSSVKKKKVVKGPSTHRNKPKASSNKSAEAFELATEQEADEDESSTDGEPLPIDLDAEKLSSE